MSDIGYQYVVLRLVPSIEREEFLNVGVVVYAQMADFLDVRCDLPLHRLEAFAPHLDPADVDAALAGICAAVRGEACAGRPAMTKLGQRFGWITAPRSTILQPGPLHGGVTDGPARTLDRLLARLVTPAGG